MLQQTSTDLLVERKGAALWVTINRPERRNALNGNVFNGLIDVFTNAESDPAIRVIVLTGAGDKAFCAGGDLKPETGVFTFDPAEPTTLPVKMNRAAAACRLPIIGRINGHSMAGGVGLVAMCDMAISVDTAKFALSEVKLGLFPMQILPLLQQVMPRRALVEMCLTGEPVDARTAREYGLVTHVVPADELDARVDAMVKSITDASPVAIRRGKSALKATASMTQDQAFSFVEGQILAVSLTEDVKEGRAAFNERRAPVWPGR